MGCQPQEEFVPKEGNYHKKEHSSSSIRDEFQFVSGALGLDGPPAILEISLKVQHVCWGAVWALGLSYPLFA